MFDVNADVRLVLVTGGPGAGKTVLCQRLYGGLPKKWRFVPLDNFIGIALANPKLGPWPDAAVKFGEVCLDYWRKEKLYPVLVEGVIQNDHQVQRLCRAFGIAWPGPNVRVLQLTRTVTTHKARRASDAEWSPPMPAGMTKEQAFENLETQVPTALTGARRIVTDVLSESQVLEAALTHLE